MSLNVQYGCGLSSPEGWINFDSSPTLRLQKIPLLGKFVKKVDFPKSVRYGDIIRGLPGISPGSCDAVYCSHVLEHLSLEDFRKALKNSFELLKRGGIFRCVLPDLEYSINRYFEERQTKPLEASMVFMKNTLLGIESRPKTIKEKIISSFGNSHHLWMWDKASLEEELRKAGFTSVRACAFNDSANPAFKAVEDDSRFSAAIAFESIK